MPIDMTKSLTSAAVGVLDEVLERNDTKNARVENFKKYADIERLALAAIGYGAQAFMPRYGKIGEALALSATPLFVKTLSHVVAKTTTTSALQAGAFVPRHAVATPAAPRPGAMVTPGDSYQLI